MDESTPESLPGRDLHFSIGAVAQITGIPEATLRIWERRYHFPQTTRTSGGQRLFSQWETVRLQWVKMRMDEGMRVGAAIRALHSAQREATLANALHEPLPEHKTQDQRLMAVSASLLAALVAYDIARAAQILDVASLEHPIESMVLEVIGPTLAAIGDSWHRGELEVATEHFATNFLRHQLLMWMLRSPPSYHDVRPVVLACAPEELHEGSLLMLGVLLRRLRWPVLYLGQSLPLSDLPTLVDHAHPSLIVFVAMSEKAAHALASWPLWLVQESETKLPILGYGGRAFAEDSALISLVPGMFLGATLHEGSQRIHRLMLHLTALQN